MVDKLTESQLEGIREAFNLFDTDGDGKITVRELGKVIRSMGHNPTDVEILSTISHADTNHNGTIEFDEFVIVMKDKMNQVHCKKNFKLQCKINPGPVILVKVIFLGF